MESIVDKTFSVAILFANQNTEEQNDVILDVEMHLNTASGDHNCVLFRKNLV